MDKQRHVSNNYLYKSIYVCHVSVININKKYTLKCSQLIPPIFKLGPLNMTLKCPVAKKYLGENCFYCIKCPVANSLAALMRK